MLYVIKGGRRAEEEAYFQEVHLQRSGPGPAPGHVLVSSRTWTLLSRLEENLGFLCPVCIAMCVLYQDRLTFFR